MTVGGTTSGYSLIGNSGIAIAPATKITIDSTAAKIGRSMKNLEKKSKNGSPYGLRLGPRAHRNQVGFNLGVRCEDLLETGDYDLVVRIEAGLHDPQTVMDSAKHDVLALGLVFRSKNIDVFAILIGHDGLVVDQHRHVFGAPFELHARIETGHKDAVRVRHHRAHVDRAGRRIYLVVDEVHRARMRKASFAGEAHPHRVFRVGPFALAGELAVPQEGLLVRLEVDIDRVLRDDAGEHGLVGLDKVAERQQSAADSARNRRTYLGEVEIELRGGQRRFGRM